MEEKLHFITHEDLTNNEIVNEIEATMFEYPHFTINEAAQCFDFVDKFQRYIENAFNTVTYFTEIYAVRRSIEHVPFCHRNKAAYVLFVNECVFELYNPNESIVTVQCRSREMLFVPSQMTKLFTFSARAETKLSDISTHAPSNATHASSNVLKLIIVYGEQPNYKEKYEKKIFNIFDEYIFAQWADKEEKLPADFEFPSFE